MSRNNSTQPTFSNFSGYTSTASYILITETVIRKNDGQTAMLRQRRARAKLQPGCYPPGAASFSLRESVERKGAQGSKHWLI